MNNTPNHHLPAATQKYKLFQGIKDAVQSIKNNFKTVLGSILVAILLTVAIVALAVVLFGSALLGEMGQVFSPTITGGSLLVSLLVIIVAGSLISALINIFMALSISDGADARKTTINDVFVRSQKLLWRVLKVNILIFVVVLAPILVIALLSLLSIIGGADRAADPALSILFILLGISSVVWVIVAALRYSLAPLVAIFEPGVPVKKTLGRSRHLLLEGGQWFLVKAIGLMILVSIVLSAITGGNQSGGLDDGSNPLGDVISYALGIIFTGVLVMLYRNRKSVRG